MKMKQGIKKLFALCLALVMVLGISIPTVANAEEGSNVIDVVEVNGVQEAIIGETVTEETFTVPDGANYTIYSGDSGWLVEYEPHYYDWLDNGTVIESGKKYQVTVHVEPAEGYEFTEDTVMKINGNVVNGYVDVENQYATWNEYYSFYTGIDKVEITNVPTAEIGGEATTQGVKVPEGANYTVGDISWYNYTKDEFLDEGDVFEKGNRYSFCISLVAKDGYEFAEDAVVLVNGEEVYEEVYLYGQRGEIYCEYSFLEQIDKIEILDELPEAKAGETAGANILEVPEGAKYTASFAWMHNDLNGVFTGEFETGEAYVLAVAVQPVAGFEFAEDVVVTIDGKPVDSIFVTNTGDSYVIMETHDLGENTIDKIEITATEPKAGEKISVDNVKVPEDAKYEIVYAAWCDAKTGRELTTGTFEEGKQYQLMVVVQTEEGVYLANDVKIMLNGKEFVGAKFDNNMVAMPFMAVCELGFDLTVIDNNQNNNNQNSNNTNNNTQNNSNQNTTIKPSPATGDNESLILWIALAVIAMTGMAVVVSKKRYED